MTDTQTSLATELRKELSITKKDDPIGLSIPYLERFAEKVENLNIGSSANSGSEQIYGNSSASIGPDDLGTVTFDVFGHGDDLLDITNPSLPVVKKDGLYTVTISVFVEQDMSEDAQFYMTLTLDVGGEDAYSVNNSASAYPDHLSPENSCTVSYWLAAGSTIEANVRNLDSIDHTFAIDVAVVTWIDSTRIV